MHIYTKVLKTVWSFVNLFRFLRETGKHLSVKESLGEENQVCKAVYKGETSQNLYTRAMEHKMKHQMKKPDSFINNHQMESHKRVD